MEITVNSSLLLADTAVSDIFVSEYLPAMQGDYVKVYLYCLFLAKHNKEITILDLSKKVGLELSRIKQALEYFNEVGLVVNAEKGIIVCDLKEKEVNRLYKPKLALSPEESADKINRNKKRSEVITAINNTFFQGIMNTVWYNDIAIIFEKYMFDEDVVYSLFKYCYDKRALHKKYLFTVAQVWFNQGVSNVNDLDNYYQKFEKTNKLKKQVAKKLGFTRNLTEYEESYIEKWGIEFGYDLTLIDLALKKTVGKSNPNFEYINKIITDWHDKGLHTKEAIEDYLAQNKSKAKFVKENSQNSTNAYRNDKQEEFKDLDRFYL